MVLEATKLRKMRHVSPPDTKSPAVCRYLLGEGSCCVFRKSWLTVGGGFRFDGVVLPTGTLREQWSEREKEGLIRMANGRTAAAKASCENCYFHQNLLCAVTDA